MSGRVCALVLLVVAALLGGCSSSGSATSSGSTVKSSGPGARVSSPAGSGASARFRRYVALGDSFSSGPLIPTTNLAGGCARSDHNYPSLVAERLGVRTFVDVTCSGARTSDLTGFQHTFGDAHIPPQLRKVTPDTDLVTIGIGGNDLALFNTLVQLCTRLAPDDPAGTPCAHELATRGIDLDDATRTITANVTNALREIKQRAPKATVLLVGYLRLVPEKGTCGGLPLAAGDYSVGRRIGLALNQAQRRAARATGVRFVNMYAVSRGHDICSSDPWVNGHVTDRERALAYHPFESGMKADADQVLKALHAR